MYVKVNIREGNLMFDKVYLHKIMLINLNIKFGEEGGNPMKYCCLNTNMFLKSFLLLLLCSGSCLREHMGVGRHVFNIKNKILIELSLHYCVFIIFTVILLGHYTCIFIEKKNSPIVVTAIICLSAFISQCVLKHNFFMVLHY